MGKIEAFRKALALPEVIQNVELTGVLNGLYTDYLELLEKNNELKEKLKKHEDIADIKRNAKVKGAVYTIDGIEEANGNKLNFCLNCLYEHGLQIPMLFGVIENGMQDLLSGQILRESTYGFTCRKCATKVTAVSTKEKYNDNR